MDYKLRDVERKLKDVEFQTLHETHSRSNCPLQYLSTTVMVEIAGTYVSLIFATVILCIEKGIAFVKNHLSIL